MNTTTRRTNEALGGKFVQKGSGKAIMPEPKISKLLDLIVKALVILQGIATLLEKIFG